ncbi:MAG TPA: hypothetical protein VIN07_06905 [Flavipsychrobacter sp.]
MLPIPNDIDVESLREKKITEVCYAQDAITIHFDSISFIEIKGYFALRIGKQRHEYYKLSPINSDYGLLQLLGKEVAEVYLNGNRDSMTIEFDEDCRLELKGHMAEDMYTIHIGDREAEV